MPPSVGEAAAIAQALGRSLEELVRVSETATLERPKMGGRAEHGTIQALPLTGPPFRTPVQCVRGGLGVTEAPTHKNRQWPKSLSQPPIRRQAASEATHRARGQAKISTQRPGASRGNREHRSAPSPSTVAGRMRGSLR
jgi:hypothetical protein